MSKTQDLQALAQTGQAKRAMPLTRKQLLKGVAHILNEQYAGKTFKSVRNVEYGFEWYLRIRSTDGTILEPVVKALNQLNRPTKRRIGSVMDVLGLDRTQLHDTFCYCHCATTTANTVATKLRALTVSDEGDEDNCTDATIR